MGLESIDFSNILFSGNDCCRPLMRFNLLLQKPCDCSDFLPKMSGDMFQYNTCMGHDERKPVFGVSAKRDSNQSTQLQTLARKLKFCVKQA